MNHFHSAGLLAKMDLPLTKGLSMIAFFGGLAAFSTYASCLPNQSLGVYSDVIGTKNPLVARIICVLVALIGWGAVIATGAALLGLLD